MSVTSNSQNDPQPMPAGTPSPDVPRVAVVGGGLTGMAAAHRLAELARAAEMSLQVDLFESQNRLGGVIGSRDIAGYRVETGADSFITNKPAALSLCRRLGLEQRLIPTDARYRRSLVLRQGKPMPVPEGFQLLSPAKVWPVLTSKIFSWPGKIRMGLEYLLPRKRQPQGILEDESLADFVRRRFGREALDRLVQPLVGGIYTSDPEKLSLLATMPRFLEMERDFRSLIRASHRQPSKDSQTGEADRSSGARYGLFATLTNGMSELLDRLAEVVAQQCCVLREQTVCEILPREQRPGYQLRMASGPTREYDAVLLGLPAWRSGELLENLLPDVSRLLQGIEYASTAIVVSGHKLSDIRDPLNAFGLVVPAIEKRRILAVSFTSRKFPGRAPAGCVQLRTFVGGAMQPELLQLSDEEIRQLVREELAELLGVSGEPDFVHVARWMRAMPQYHLGHLERIARIESALQATPRLVLAGNAFHGVGVPDCIQNGETAAEAIFSRLSS